MSSSTYLCELHPEAALRRLVVLAAIAACLTGLAVIMSLPVQVVPRALAALACCIAAGAELRVITTAYKRFTSIQVDADGNVRIRDRQGQWRPATISRHSIVLAGLACLRLKPDRGRPYPELLRGNARESQQWRRLQVIWRQLGRAA